MFAYKRELRVHMPIHDDFWPLPVVSVLFHVILNAVWPVSQKLHAFVHATLEVERSIDDTDMGILCFQRVLSQRFRQRNVMFSKYTP